MSKQVQGYVRFALSAAALAAARATLATDKGLPRTEWTKAHREAVSILSGEYGVAPQKAEKQRLEWSCGLTFEKGSAPQKALSRVCGFITGQTQKKMRELNKARAAFKKMDKADQKVAIIEASFEKIEKMAKAEDLSGAQKTTIRRHAKFLLSLLG